MKKGFVELVFVLDKSGSMSGLESDTIGGFNSMLKKQKKLDGECRITTVLFNESCRLLHDRIDIQAVEAMNESDYFAGGSTALLDAVGMTIDKLAAVQKSTAAEYRAESVLFVIITDGMENASRKYSLKQVKAMIEREKEQYGWEFIFLGTNIDAVETAAGFGIDAEYAADYVPDAAGTALNFETMSETASCFRETRAIPSFVMQKIREDAGKRGDRT